VADEVAYVIDRKLEAIAGAGPVRKELLERVSKLQERLLAGASESAAVLRSRSLVHTQRGDVALTHDDLALARKEYEAALAIRRKLSEADPSNAVRKRDLSVSYNKLGDVAQAGGDLSGARGFFEKSLELIKALSEADPSNANWQIDLVVSHTQLTSLALDARDVPEARTHHAAATALLDRLEQSGRTKGNALAGQLRAALNAAAAHLPRSRPAAPLSSKNAGSIHPACRRHPQRGGRGTAWPHVDPKRMGSRCAL